MGTDAYREGSQPWPSHAGVSIYKQLFHSTDFILRGDFILQPIYITTDRLVNQLIERLLMVHGLWLMDQGSWLMAAGRATRGPGARPGPRRHKKNH